MGDAGGLAGGGGGRVGGGVAGVYRQRADAGEDEDREQEVGNRE